MLKEPLLHFLLLGVLIFVVHALVADHGPENDEIVLTSAKQQRLLASFAATWNRAPTEPEFESILEDWIREELAYRQGLEMGLDTDDTVIRRRLRQKVELLAEEIVSMAPPEAAELQAFLDANQSDYIGEPRISLRQITFGIDDRGANAAVDARAALAALTSEGSGADPADLGDPIPLPRQMTLASPSLIASRFGREFTDAVTELTPGNWQGPIESGFGWHLVFVDEHVPAEAPTLETVGREVQRDYNRQQRDVAIDRLYEELAQSYTISVESPEQAPAS